MDLSLLPHLSDDALRAEAARRGLEVAGLERDGIIAAIRASAARTVPPAPRAARVDAPTEAEAAPVGAMPPVPTGGVPPRAKAAPVGGVPPRAK
ncbi:MAG TPA: hypothetical protein RMH99_04065, partial [Sandaracinaceae bacterium LLY-WYZ-13_1]|nr:hypothetical protein [Sandaracinaceae bacterium LLY-WYZ-13_1]